MNFNFERQGPVTYLVCELDATEVIDTLTLGMLTNNHIVGLAPVLYTELNGQRFLKYNISAKISAGHFFAGEVARERALEAFTNIANSICVADDYMIDQSCFKLSPEYVFLNVSSCEASLVCIPVLNNSDVNEDIAELFSELVKSSGLEASGQLPQMTEYLADRAAFNIYGLKNIIEEEKKGFVPPKPVMNTPVSPLVNSTPAEEPKPLLDLDEINKEPAAPVIPSQPVSAPAIGETSVLGGGVSTPSPVISDFNSTISINDAPAMFKDGGLPKPPVEEKEPVINEPFKPVIPKVQTPPQPPVTPNPVMGGGLGGVGKGNTGGFMNKPQPVTPDIPKTEDKPNIAIPGMGGVQIPGKSNVPPVMPGNGPQQEAPKKEGEKKKSFFSGLFAKKEKPAKEPKQKKQKSAPAGAVQVPGAPLVQPVVNTPPFGGAGAQPMMGGGFAGQQPMPGFGGGSVPVQNQFNATTVLDNSVGETTVLSAVMPKPGEPYLTRVKNQEQILINKPVFRIGKEKSYVDFFISDNTAISRSHANIIIENGQCFVEDMNSTNHTFVNGAMITGNQKVQLKDSDIVRLANEEFIFHC